MENKLLNDKEAAQILNKIDNSITNAVIFAEKRCRKIKSGQVPYTPEISQLGKEINVWNNVIRKKHGSNISST